MGIFAITICQAKTMNKNKMKSHGGKSSLVFPCPNCLACVFQLFPAFMGRHLTIFQFTQFQEQPSTVPGTLWEQEEPYQCAN